MSDAIGPADIEIEEWRPDRHSAALLDHDLDTLAEVLRIVVYGGAGVSFIVPFSFEDARTFWRDSVLPGVRAGTRRVLVARSSTRIVATVQLDLAVPPNQQHRAEVLKMLVHPAARRRGLARALMLALEGIATSAGRTLLTLDTWTGSPAETLYQSLGYVTVGVIPRYARGSLTPELEPATIMQGAGTVPVKGMPDATGSSSRVRDLQALTAERIRIEHASRPEARARC